MPQQFRKALHKYPPALVLDGLSRSGEVHHYQLSYELPPSKHTSIRYFCFVTILYLIYSYGSLGKFSRISLDQRFWSIHSLAFLRATLSASLLLLQHSVGSPHTVCSSSLLPPDFNIKAKGTQRSSARLWEQTLIV